MCQPETGASHDDMMMIMPFASDASMKRGGGGVGGRRSKHFNTLYIHAGARSICMCG